MKPFKIKTNEPARTLQELKFQNDKSESEKKDFQNKFKTLKEENNDFRSKNNYMKYKK